MRAVEFFTECAASDALARESLRRLHPRVIDRDDLIKELLTRVADRQLPLEFLHADIGIANPIWLEEVGQDELLLRVGKTFSSISEKRPPVLNFHIDGRSYFFSAPVIQVDGDRRARVALPVIIYEEERRDRARTSSWKGLADTILLRSEKGESVRGRISDASASGFSASLEYSGKIMPGMLFEIINSEEKIWKHARFAEVRNKQDSRRGQGWKRIGFSVLPGPRGGEVRIQRWNDVTRRLRSWSEAGLEVRRKAHGLGGTSEAAEDARTHPLLQPEPNVVGYRNADGELIKAIIDVTGDSRGAPAVVIPPAWGKTKETTLGLAAAIVAAFREVEQSVTVLRFDGIRRRGESAYERGSKRVGYENVDYTFSQGVRDIQETIDFLERDSRFQPSTTILATFSISAVEARRVIAEEARGRIGGWISVVGAPDLQSALRAVSGGMDYLGGIERGLRFGVQSVEGLLLNIDQAGRDAIEHGLGFLEDGWRDMARIEVPVTWICGRDDAWIDIDRVRDMLSVGMTENRKIVEVPTGHRLRSSREAGQIFRIVAGEVTKMTLGVPIVARESKCSSVSQRFRAERRRLRRGKLDVLGFWKEYLLGKNGGFGLELIANTDIYREFMRQQVAALDLTRCDTVADLGSGVGMLAREICRTDASQGKLKIFQIDFVKEGLTRGREALESYPTKEGLELHYIVGNLDYSQGQGATPVRSKIFDAVIASLLLNYVGDPMRLLCDMKAMLRPGGRLVISSLRRDADISMIYARGVAELRLGRGREVFGGCEGRAERSIGEFLNSAARLVDLEEQGKFSFWSSAELRKMLERTGFSRIDISTGLGRPPQAYIATAWR